MNTFDVIIQGAGASGLWCAMTAARRGLSVCIVDHADKAGKKIRIAGGGKGNLTNLELTAENYVATNPHFCKSALARLTQWDIVEFLSIHNIPWEEREHGQLFCTTTAKDMVRALISECAKHNVTILLNREIKQTAKQGEMFLVGTSVETIQAPNLVVALGGPAWPQAGATDTGYRIAKQFGHKVISPYPALTPFIMKAGQQHPPCAGEQRVEKWDLVNLQGIALPASITVGQKTYTENLLFTHNGISGPVTLQASCHWRPRQAICINFLPAHDLETLLNQASSKQLVKTVLTQFIPARLTEALIPAQLAAKQIAQLSKKDRTRITQRVQTFTVIPERTGGFKKAEVTGGGIDTSCISSKTMESTLEKGVYFIGEVLDVTGELGGFNLHWAWASGHACGTALIPQ